MYPRAAHAPVVDKLLWGISSTLHRMSAASSSFIMANVPPFLIGQAFDSHEEALERYRRFAKERGFSVRLGKSYTSKNDEIRKRDFVCHRQGLAPPKKSSSLKPRKRETIRCDCKAMLRISLSNDENSSDHKKWIV